MREIPMVTTYMGKDIRTLTREELIEALEFVVSERAWLISAAEMRSGNGYVIWRGER